MAAAARQDHRNYYAPATRVYSYGATAAALQPAYRPEPETVPLEQEFEQAQPRQQAKARPATSPLRKALAVLAVCATAGVMLFLLVRYARIAEEYAVINDLKDKIAQSELNLAALNVELQLAVSLEDAEATAKQIGMTYPTARQIHRLGEPITQLHSSDLLAEPGLSPQLPG